MAEPRGMVIQPGAVPGVNSKIINTAPRDGDTEEKWLIAASSAGGASTRIQLRCPPEMTDNIARIVQSGKFQYRTSADVWRHAQSRHLEWLETQDPDLVTHIHTIRAVSDIIQEEETAQEFAKALERLRAVVATHIGAGRSHMARAAVQKIWDSIARLPESDPWRDVHAQAIRQNWPDYADVMEVAE